MARKSKADKLKEAREIFEADYRDRFAKAEQVVAETEKIRVSELQKLGFAVEPKPFYVDIGNGVSGTVIRYKIVPLPGQPQMPEGESMPDAPDEDSESAVAPGATEKKAAPAEKAAKAKKKKGAVKKK